MSIKTKKALKKALKRIEKSNLISLDTETISVENKKLTGIGIGLSDREYYIYEF